MEGEVNNIILICTITFISLFYCHTIGKYIPHGSHRLLAIAPITCLFQLLPLYLSTIHLCILIFLCISMITNFKLFLFAFGKEPLCNPFNDRPIPLSRFFLVACFPIEISHNPPPSIPKELSKFEDKQKVYLQNLEDHARSHEETLKRVHHWSLLSFATKVLMVCINFAAYISKNDLNSNLRTTFYCIHLCLMLDITMSFFAILTHALIRVELKPQFNKPYLATSLQNFWGRRWNLMVSSILRSTVYRPVRSVLSRLMVPRKWTSRIAILVTFFVSGIQHEIIFYYLGRQRPTGIITIFFIVQGICMNIENCAKETLKGKFELPTIISRGLTIGFLIGTASWLLHPSFHSLQPDVRACKEIVALLEFATHGRLISPNDISCPSM